MGAILLQGQYRVQSRRDYAPSLLEGDWYDAPGLIDCERINAALRRHPAWRGTAQVALRPALLRRRAGKFASEPDILYKRELFAPAPGTAPMPANIVDVLKARRKWRERAGWLRQLFPHDSRQVMLQLREPALAIANEYVVHEAGHFIGYDVQAKQRDGYFAPGGKTCWPLVYLEELRADLNAFGFARQLLSPQRASDLFLYNVMLRFGVHREGIVRDRRAPYGLVPYLLFHLLQALGCIGVQRQDERPCLGLTGLDSGTLCAMMDACARHAERALNAPELQRDDPLDRALAAAAYVRERVDDTAAAARFASVMNQPVAGA